MPPPVSDAVPAFSRPIVLTIAGSDSGGGAGIQADLKTFHAFGVFGVTAVTAVTAQSTLGVSAVHPMPVEIVSAQIEAVLDDLPPSAVKTGMLATASVVSATARALSARGLDSYVLDPVMISTSGHRLLDEEARATLVEELLPLARVVTPNIHEAQALTGRRVGTVAEMRAAARSLVRIGASAALVKGGHLPGEEAVDVLWDGRDERVWRRPRIQSPGGHGTGCTLSAAIAANLGLGTSLVSAAARAIGYVARAIEHAPALGRGLGPIDHFVPVDPPA